MRAPGAPGQGLYHGLPYVPSYVGANPAGLGGLKLLIVFFRSFISFHLLPL